MPNPLHALPLADLRRRTSAKWRLYPEDVLPLWVAEMDVPLAAPVARVLADTVALGDTGYAMGGEYVEALVEFAARRWDWRIEPAHAAVVPDVMRGIVEVLRLVTAPGDTVVVNPPVYPPFYLFVAHMDRQVAEAPLTPDGRLDPVTLDVAFARAAAGRRGAAYLLCNPHNPTGAVHTRQELAAVADLAGRYRVRVVSDEIHAPLVFGAARYVPYLTVPGGADAFALLSASKAWNLAGLKAAVAVAGPDAAGDLARMPEEVSHGPSHLGVRTHSVALREGGPWLDEVLAGLDENRRLLADLLAEHLPEVRYQPPEATYLAWLDCRALVPDGADPAELFLERGRVALTGATGFGTGAAGFARLNFATSPEILAEAVRRMASAVSPPWHRR